VVVPPLALASRNIPAPRGSERPAGTPVSREMILNHVAEHALGLPKSY